jgi:predicted transcriptional regulator
MNNINNVENTNEHLKKEYLKTFKKGVNMKGESRSRVTYRLEYNKFKSILNLSRNSELRTCLSE